MLHKVFFMNTNTHRLVWPAALSMLLLLAACAAPPMDASGPFEATEPVSRSADAVAADAVPAEAVETETTEPQAAAAAMPDVIFTRHREGGIAGFCDDITVYGDGQFEIESCKGDATRSAQLTAEQIATVEAWAMSYDAFSYGSKDPATADAMTISLDFNGVGAEAMTEEQQVEMVNFANELFMQAGS